MDCQRHPDQIFKLSWVCKRAYSPRKGERADRPYGTACSGMTVTNSPSHQPVGEIADGLAIDRRAIPFAHRLEIRRALAIRRAGPEAASVQQVGGGGEHVGHAVAEIDVAVAVEIDAGFDIGRRQDLRLADLAGVSADHVVEAKVAALHDLHGGEQFALE